MNKYKFLYLFWLLPAYFLFLTAYQTAVYFSLKDTYEDGESYIAEMTDFEIEQVAGQINGHAVITFSPGAGDSVQRSLALSHQIIERISEAETVPIRYKKDNFMEVVIMPTYEIQNKFVLSNMGMAAVAFIISFAVAFIAHRHARKKMTQGSKEWVIERV